MHVYSATRTYAVGRCNYSIVHLFQVGRKLTDELLNKKGEFNTELDRVIELEQDLQKTFAVTVDIRL